MSELKLSTEDRKRLVDLIAQRAGVLTPGDRHNFLERAGLDHLVIDLPLEGPARAFASRLVRALRGSGDLEETGQPALVSLLHELREIVRGHRAEREFVDKLLRPYRKIEVPDRPLRLFISYRRTRWPFTQQLASDLERALGADVFVDIDSIDETNFEQSILRHLRTADAVLAVISEETFSERIHQPGDWVRRELEMALELEKPVILVGIDGRVPPAPDELPATLRELPKMQAIFFYPDYRQAAVERLVRFLQKIMAEPYPIRIDRTPSAPSARGAGSKVPQAADEGKMLEEALAAFDNGNYDKTLFLLRELAARGYTPNILTLEALIERAEAAQRADLERAAMLEEYRSIAALARFGITRNEARDAWRAFQEAYPNADVDSEGLATLLQRRPREGPPKAKSEWRVTPTEQQRVLLDVMLDPERPPPERAQAGRELAQIGDPRRGVGVDAQGVPDIAWVRLKGGRFPVGGDAGAYQGLDARVVTLDEFRIAKYPVTNGQYAAFFDDGGYLEERYWEDAIADDHFQNGVLRVTDWNGEGWVNNWTHSPQDYGPPFTTSNHPRVGVSWYEAVAFCHWLTEKLGLDSSVEVIRLPTEEEWERAARGRRGRIYPWPGSKYESGYANIDETKKGDGPYYLKQTSAVGIYPQGDTPEGICDLSGNVWEWTATAGKHKGVDIKWLRGGSWYYDPRLARAASRFRNLPHNRFRFFGFRVVCGPPLPP